MDGERRDQRSGLGGGDGGDGAVESRKGAMGEAGECVMSRGRERRVCGCAVFCVSLKS